MATQNGIGADWPTVSVIIPCRNMGQYVGAAIASALAQTRPVHEVIVVDDGSTDDTPQVLAGFGARIRVLAGPGKGSAISRNLGILASSGEYIAFLDADDMWYPQKLATQIGQMRAQGRLFAFSDFHRGSDPASPGAPVLASYSAVAEGWVFANLLRENFVATSSAVVHRDLLGRAGIFNTQLRGGQDFDLWLRLARQGEIGWVREPLLFFRQHPQSITVSTDYPFLHVRVWEEVLAEHRDAAPQDRRYIRHRLGLAAYNAGRHAVRQKQFKRARALFRQAASYRHRWAVTLPWLLLSYAPAPLVGLLLDAKRKCFAAAPAPKLTAAR